METKNKKILVKELFIKKGFKCAKDEKNINY